MGANIYEPHTCVCGKNVSARRLHGLACSKSAGRQQRHALLNDMIWRAVRIACVQAIKEPIGLLRAYEKRPYGASLIPWAKCKCLAWNITVPGTYADSHLTAISSAAGSTASEAAIHKAAIYVSIANTHHFVPVVIETSGVFDKKAEAFLQQVGHKCTRDDWLSNRTSYLFQQISIAILRGNAIVFHDTFAK